MLAVHWTPVNNTKNILKNGITKSRKGLYCFPLTGHKSVDRWWLYFFNQCGVRHRKKYNGIVFRLRQQDMPAYFGHWIGATSTSSFNKEIITLEQLKKEFRDQLMFRLGEYIAQQTRPDDWVDLKSEEFIAIAEAEIKKDPKALINKMNSADMMRFALEDYQIVLSNSISPDRIIKVLPQENEFGRVLKNKKIQTVKHRKKIPHNE